MRAPQWKVYDGGEVIQIGKVRMEIDSTSERFYAWGELYTGNLRLLTPAIALRAKKPELRRAEAIKRVHAALHRMLRAWLADTKREQAVIRAAFLVALSPVEKMISKG